MEKLFDNILKQGRTLLFSFIELMPLWMVIIHLAWYSTYVAVSYSEPPEWMYYADSVLRHFFEGSFVTLLLMLILSTRWRTISKISFACLCALWLLNTPYILFGWDADLYFYCFSSIIYVTFVILTVYVLINR